MKFLGLFLFVCSNGFAQGYLCTAHCGTIVKANPQTQGMLVRITQASGPTAAESFTSLQSKCKETLYNGNYIFFQNFPHSHGSSAGIYDGGSPKATQDNSCIELY